jgi:thiol:disulfide interchange protein
MKFLVPFFLVSYLNTPAINWQTDFEKAKAEAVQSHKRILLNFSGSDWCIPCIRLHKEIFDAEMQISPVLRRTGCPK